MVRTAAKCLDWIRQKPIFVTSIITKTEHTAGTVFIGAIKPDQVKYAAITFGASMMYNSPMIG
jgi:hypothetical protein